MIDAKPTYVRLFVALQTPSEIRGALLPILEDLKETGADVRWEPSEKLHATVKFLGNTDQSLVPRLSSELRDIARSYGPVGVRFLGIGCFPNLRRPRVVWVGMEDSEGHLSRIHQSIETAAESLGFKKEDRVFHPHVTLGRVRSPRGLQDLLTRLQTITFESGRILLNELVLMRSELKAGGSVYSVKDTFPFAGS
jgi:2'-5' RNA ligase